MHPSLKANWELRGGAAGTSLGTQQSTAVTYAGGGVQQQFANGWLIYKPGLGVFRLTGETARYYFEAGGVNGAFGYPINDVSGLDAVSHTQDFELGRITWYPDGTFVIKGGFALNATFFANWKALGGASSELGFAVADRIVLNSVWSYQEFETG